MGICQWIVVGLLALRLALALRVHGMSRLTWDGKAQKYNFYWTLWSTLVLFVPLYFGGFFGRA